MQNFRKEMSRDKTLQNAALKLHPTGKGDFSVDMLKSYTDLNMKNLSEEEKLAVCFLNIGLVKSDSMVINPEECAKVAR